MRPVPLTLGLAVLALAWAGPLPLLAGHSFTAHMAMHLAVVAVAAPLIAIGLAGSRWDPSVRRPGLFAPVPTSLVELVVVWAWHVPALHHAARSAAPLQALEQASFLAAGLLLWLSCLGGGAQGLRGRNAAGIVALLLTSMHMTLLGALLALTPRPLYPHGEAHAGHGMLALSPLEDQHLGGILMLIVGGSVYLAGGLGLMARLLSDGGTPGRAEPSHPLPARQER